jgi:amino acid adenylation domain-containing protein
MNTVSPDKMDMGSPGAKRELLARLLKVASPDRYFPLSFAQQRLWFVDQLHPNTVVYSLPGALKIAGILRAEVLEQVINEVIRRHEVLRTTYENSPQGPRQIIHEFRPQPLPIVNLEGLGYDERSTESRWLAQKEASRLFDLIKGPVVRVTLLQSGPADHVILYTFHHIASDGWSQGVLNREIGLLYGTFSAGKPSTLPELPIQYADYASWQREWLQGEVGERQLAYWKKQLTGLNPFQLPTDKPRPTMLTFSGAKEESSVPEELTMAVRALGRREGTTLFMTLLSSFQLLLNRYSGDEDIAIGVPIAGRNRTEIEGLIGCFVNTLVLRVDLSGDPSVTELLERVKAVSLAAYVHQDLPFERLVEELEPERDPSRNPLVQVELELENIPNEGVNLQGVHLRSMGGVEVRTALDLEWHVQESARGLTAQVIYSTDLFEKETITRMVAQWRRLLEAITKNPEQKISELELLSGAERDLLSAWNRTRQKFPSDQCLHKLFKAQAIRNPGAIAVTFAGDQLSYRELDQRSDRVAKRLRALGVGPELLVGLAAGTSLEAIIGMLAILKAGAAYVPLDPTYPVERLAYMIEDAGISVLLTQRNVEEKMPAHASIVEYLDAPEAAEEMVESAENADYLDSENLAYMIYTSGSTGNPKGVLVSHRSVVNSTLARLSYYQTPIRSTLLLLSFAFDASLGGVFGTLCQGGSLVLPTPEELRNAAHIVNLIAQHRVSHLFCLPSVYGTILSRRNSGSLLSLQVCVTGGEPCPSALWVAQEQWLPTAELFNEYGPTEATVWSTVHKVVSPQMDRIIGRPICNAQIYILGNRMEVMPPGLPGELYIGGDGLARGYHNSPTLTSERFLPHPLSEEPGRRLYRTGDRARFLSNGQLQFLGRGDHQIKIRGFRIELGEIETVLRGHPQIENAAVVARGGEEGEKQLMAYVACVTGADLPVEVLRKFLKQKLPGHMVPERIVMLEVLPMTPNGKVDRKKLPLVERNGKGDNYTAPGTAAEATLAEIWTKVLRLEQVGIHDNFFENGGDSILSVQIVARANEAGLELTTKDLFECQTIAKLVENIGSSGSIVVQESPVAEPVGLTPIQHLYFEVTDADSLNEAIFHPQLLIVGGGKKVNTVETVIRKIVRHHDALRLRFEFVDGRWRQFIPLDEEYEIFALVDLSELSSAEQSARISQETVRAQRSLDLQKGPIIRAMWFDLGPPARPRLLLLVHHMAVDGVSWRILLEDLQRGCRCVENGKSIELGQSRGSFLRWSERLQTHARSAVLESEIEYWLGLVKQSRESLPQDYPGGENLTDSEATVSVWIGEKETQALLQEVPEKYHTQINDALLTAWFRAFMNWTGRRRLLLDLEGHGREHLFEDIDITRTVGWFTSLYPVGLAHEGGNHIGALLTSVKEQLRKIPRH